jgi:azurin
MTITYEEVTNVYGDEIVIKSDGDVRTVFLKDLANADYQAYLKRDEAETI